jgi:ATP-binding cassette subfamily B protein
LTRRATGDEFETRSRPLDVRLITRLLAHTRPYAAKRNWLLLLVVLRSVQLPGLIWALAAIIKGPVAAGSFSGIVWGAAGFAALALSTQIVFHFRQRFALELGEAVVGDLRNALFAQLQRMPMSFFNRTRLGRLISRLTSDVEEVRVGVQEVLFVSLVQLGQMLVAAACMLWYDAWLFLIVAGLSPVLWLMNRQFHRKLSDQLRAVRDSFSRVTATLAESVLGVRVTQGYVRQDENARMFRDLIEDHSNYNAAVMKTHGLFLPLIDLNNQVFLATLLLVGGWQALRPGSMIDIGDLVGFFFMANMFFGPISNLATQYNQALTAMAGAERLFSLLDARPDWTDAPTARDLQSIRGAVEFDHVTFGYDPQRPVVHDVSFHARPGETVALVGHTGSGKSTLVSLVSKFYLPTRGVIRVDGQDLNDVTGESLHRQMGIVLQQNFLFMGTVADNVRLGRQEATDADVANAARQLGCLEILEALPQGLRTHVGEGGRNLSLGQRQLVCLCRAMLADPRILILDEATSSVDTITESRIRQALAALLHGRTSFVVAHRLSTVRHADLVLVLDHGRIIERGTHAQLLALEGAYASLYRRFLRGTED